MNLLPFVAMTKLFGSRARRLAGIVGMLLAASTALQSAGIPEPDTIIYGRVVSFDHGYDVPITRGDLVWKIQPNGDDSRTYELHATLAPITNGSVVLAYRLKVPHEALASGLSFADVSPQTLPVGEGTTRYRHVEIRVNGEVARILPPGAQVFEASQTARLSAHRLDLEVVLPMQDTNGRGLPDWWQQRFFGQLGVDPDGDADHDGLSNRSEYQGGTDPTHANNAPTLVWSNAVLDEGATEVVALQIVDSDTPATNLVYTVLEEPVGAHLTLLFGAKTPDAEGKWGDLPLKAGETFTQADVNAGRVVITHDDPDVDQVNFRLKLSDEDVQHPALESTLSMIVHKPTLVDGSDAAVWMSARFAATNEMVTTWKDQSGSKVWFDGNRAPFDALAVSTSLQVTNQGPLAQPALSFNLSGQQNAQSLALPGPGEATVFPAGEITVIAALKSTGDGSTAEQIVTGPHFQLGLTGPDDQGREQQIRFASETGGVVYSNRKVRDQWIIVSAWQEQHDLNIELNGVIVGGPHPLDPSTQFGTDPAIGGRKIGTRVDQLFQGYLGEVLVFNRNLEDAERHRINYSLMSKWFGWVLLDGSGEPRDLNWRVASSGLSPLDYDTKFVPKHGPDRRYIILGGAGKDTLQGGQNDDIIVGGRQPDTMTGGRGRDLFVFNYSHIHHGADTIVDFNPSEDLDAINLADLLRGSSRDLRDFLRLRTDGHSSRIEIDFTGAGRYTDQSIILQGIVLRDSDLASLWSHGNLLTGDKGFPLWVSSFASSPVATEISASPGSFNIHFEGAIVPDHLEIPFQLAGTAVRDIDYILSSQHYNHATGSYEWNRVEGAELFVDLKPGDFDFTVRVEPIQNPRAQPDRTVRLELTAVPEWYSVTGALATVRITDGPQRVGVTASKPVATEAGDVGSFTLTRAGGLNVPLDVAIDLIGPAENGVDYEYVPTVVHFNANQASALVAVTTIPDDLRELPEAVELVLQPGTGYVIDPQAQAASVVIQDSGPLITLKAIEPLAVVQDGSPGVVLVRRQGMLQESINVVLDIGGTATPTVDYRRLSRLVTFGPGVSTALVTIQPTATAVITGSTETIDLRVLPDPTYVVGQAASAQVRLVNGYLTFPVWKARLFPGDTTPPALFANEDYEHDGIRNALEYAYGLDPKAPGTKGLPQPVVQNGRLGMRFTRPISAVDVVYLIEVSADLVHWFPANAVFDQLPGILKTDGIEEVTFLDQQPIGDLPTRFIRVTASIQ